MSGCNVAILVMGYNRFEPFKRLLDSLLLIQCDDNLPLIISIDAGGTPEINKMVNEYVWDKGEKKVCIHEKRLGLRNHFIWGGDLTNKYQNILFLEDDLMPTPYAVEITKNLIDKYSNDKRIAAGSLYAPLLCEFNDTKFYQVQDGYDVFFLAHPYWGTIWMKDAWNDFKEWYSHYEYRADLIPESVNQWKNQSSFKKVFIQYLSETNKTCVYPRNSLVTNMGFAGVNAPLATDSYQTVLEVSNHQYRLPALDESKSRYDVFMEIDPIILKNANPKLQDYDFDVDLKQTKILFTKEYVLTTRKVKHAILSFCGRMKPIENAIILDVAGQGISLALKSDVILENDKAKHAAEDIKKNYPLEPKTSLYYALSGIKKYCIRKSAVIKSNAKKFSK